MRRLTKRLLMLPALLCMTSCMSPRMNDGFCDYWYTTAGYNVLVQDTNDYNEIVENGFTDTAENNKSSFSLDTSTAAYTNIKSLVLDERRLPSTNAVMIEQMLNYFTYDYQIGENQDLAIYNEISNCPWNEDSKLVSIAVKAKEVKEEERLPMNLVFLIDVSGSMSDSIALIKSAFGALCEQLNSNDRVSIVTYANGVSTILDGAKGSDTQKIMSKVNSLRVGGGTNGSKGLQRAYSVAQKSFIAGGNNRIILATDGDFNIGISTQDELSEYISTQRDSGIYISILGFGNNNYHNSTAETIIKNGNGNMFYIHNEDEIFRLFEGGLAASLEVVAKDCKSLVTFDVNQVASYRLLGYENAMLSEEQYEDNTVDAGEICAGHVTVAMYEIKLTNNCDLSKNLFTSALHFKDPNTTEDKEVVASNALYNEIHSYDFTFQGMICEYALVLRNSKYKGTASLGHVLDLYDAFNEIYENDERKSEFYHLVEVTKLLIENRYVEEY